VSNELVKNGGRLLIVDNDCQGHNRLFGNLTRSGRYKSGDKILWSTKLSTAYHRDSGMADDRNRLEVPMIDLREPFPHISGVD
jgi:hypothetical protein